MFFKETESSEELPMVSTTDILLYKETPMEAKIISAILHKLDYSVDVVENIDELKKVMDVNSYKCILLDRVTSEIEHSNVTQHIKAKEIPSLLFVDGQTVVVPSDKENFTFISDKVTDYQSIKVKVDQMIALAKVS
jgi:DNA-binding NtrC family response regulator